MSELVSPPIIAFGRLMLPERFAGHGRTPRNHRHSHRFETLPVHVIALRTSPEGVFNLLPQIVVSSSPGGAKS